MSYASKQVCTPVMLDPLNVAILNSLPEKHSVEITH